MSIVVVAYQSDLSLTCNVQSKTVHKIIGTIKLLIVLWDLCVPAYALGPNLQHVRLQRRPTALYIHKSKAL